MKIIKFVKPKKNLPDKIILHDAVITGCVLKKDLLKLSFSGGFQLITDGGNAEKWTDV